MQLTITPLRSAGVISFDLLAPTADQTFSTGGQVPTLGSVTWA